MSQPTKPASPEIVFVSVALRIFGGYKRTTEDDIIKAGGSLPKTDVLTKGGKHIFPSEPLAPFHALKKQLTRDISKISVKSVGGVQAFNKVDLKEVEDLVKNAEKEFAALLVTFKQNYQADLSKYIDEQVTAGNTGLADIIRQSALTVDEAVSRFGFAHEMYVPQPIGEGNTIETMAQNLAGRLFVEIAQAAYELWDKSIMPSDSNGVRSLKKAGQKTKRPITACRDKLAKLAFLDGNIQNAIDVIDVVLAETQPQGFVEDTPSNRCATRLVKLVELMMDAQRFRSATTKVYTDLGEIDQLLGMTAVTAPVLAAESVTTADAESAAKASPDLVVASSQQPGQSYDPFAAF